MAGKFYAVRKGRETGVFNSWAECSRQINGFSGAEYKSFKTAAEAMDYVMGGQKKAPVTNYSSKEKVYAYVDGSSRVTLDETELSEAVWFQRDEIPREDTTNASLTHEMIEVFRKNKVYEKQFLG